MAAKRSSLYLTDSPPRIRKTWRLRVYDFLAAPAHAWIWLCSKLLRLRFYVLVTGSLNDAGEIDATSIYIDDRLD